MDTGARGADVGARTTADDRWVVVLRGSRPHARVFGSVTGPSVLAPGRDEDTWQVLRVLTGSDAASQFAHTVRFPPGVIAGLVDPAALALGRSDATRTLVVPNTPTTSVYWTWTRAGAPRDTEITDLLVDEVAAVGGVDPADIRAVLLAEWTDRDPLRELVALLGLPVTAADILEVPDTDALRLGEALLPADERRHDKALAKSLSPSRPTWAEVAAEVRNTPGPRPFDRFFGVAWMLLGTAISLLGLLFVVRGIRPESSVLGVSSPPALVVMGAAIAWVGSRLWRRGSARRA